MVAGMKGKDIGPPPRVGAPRPPRKDRTAEGTAGGAAPKQRGDTVLDAGDPASRLFGKTAADVRAGRLPGAQELARIEERILAEYQRKLSGAFIESDLENEVGKALKGWREAAEIVAGSVITEKAGPRDTSPEAEARRKRIQEYLEGVTEDVFNTLIRASKNPGQVVTGLVSTARTVGESNSSGYTGDNEVKTEWAKPGYTGPYGETMGDADEIQEANIVARVRSMPREKLPALAKLIDDLERASGETTGRATAKPRPDEAPPVPAPSEPRPVTAQELFEDVPPTQRAKPRQKYKFSPELLDDPDALSRAQSVANARRYKIREHHEISPEEDARGKKAESFVKQAQRRQRRAAADSQLSAG